MGRHILGPKASLSAKQEDYISKERLLPCIRGHSRQDAYVRFNRQGKPYLACRTCCIQSGVIARNKERDGRPSTIPSESVRGKALEIPWLTDLGKELQS